MRRRESHLKRSPYGIEYNRGYGFHLVTDAKGNPLQFTSEHFAHTEMVIRQHAANYGGLGGEFRVVPITQSTDCRKFFRAPAIRPIPANFGEGGSL